MRTSFRFLIFPILLSVTLLYSCSDDSFDDVLGCSKGTITLVNLSHNPYEIYIDGDFVTTLGGNKSMTRELSEGNHSFKAEQQSGYLLYPTIVNTSKFISCSEPAEWRFP